MVWNANFYGIWKMPEWNGRLQEWNGRQSSILDFDYGIHRKIYMDIIPHTTISGVFSSFPGKYSY